MSSEARSAYINAQLEFCFELMMDCFADGDKIIFSTQSFHYLCGFIVHANNFFSFWCGDKGEGRNIEKAMNIIKAIQDNCPLDLGKLKKGEPTTINGIPEDEFYEKL